MTQAAFWFKNDLRLNDNPGLLRALELSKGAPLVAFYILDEKEDYPVQGASAWWLHHSLCALGESLAKMGHSLVIRKGDSLQEVKKLCRQFKINALHFSRRYDPAGVTLQKDVQQWCTEEDIECARFASSLLFEPDSIANKQAKPFKVFTPFYKHCRSLPTRSPKLTPKKSRNLQSAEFDKTQVAALKLLPDAPDWAFEFSNHWTPGEKGARENLKVAIDELISDYAQQRDFPAISGTSRLSAHLRFGEISPASISQEVSSTLRPEQAEPWLRQLIWREFSYYLLFHFPHICTQPFAEKFKSFKWRKNKKNLLSWQQAKTGYPLVDAAMRELWHSGWMHNRCRMVVASFLTKHLGLHWLEGANWFWDTLVDADLANNIAGWQWVAGCGADAAPYFRVFNPTTQAEKFDPNGDYIRRWVPELSKLPTKAIHSPWLADETTLQQAGVKLGVNYPHPIVDHKQAREQALEAYRDLS